jgi:hypothetical protein
VADASSITFGSQVIVNEPLTLVTASSMAVDGTRTQTGSFVMVSVSGMTLAGNKKWNPESDTAETWDAIADNSETWTPVTDTSETWDAIADSNESWSVIADNSETWQIAA